MTQRTERIAPASAAALVAATALLAAALSIPPAAVRGADVIPTTTTVEVTTPGPIGVWQPITLLATVTPVHATAERVEFLADGLRIGSAPLDVEGQASYTYTAGLAAGEHMVSAGYPGTDGYGWSNSAQVPVSVVDNRTPVSLTFAASPSSTLPGEIFDMDVTITPNPGAGYVAFTKEPATSIGDLVPVGADGTVHTTGWINGVGTWQLHACFLGTMDFREACSPSIVHETYKLTTTTTLTLERARIYPDEPLRIAVDVVPAPETPSVVYLDGMPPLSLDATGHGQAEYLPGQHLLPVGEHDLTATFPGTAQLHPSTSAPVRLSIWQDPVTLTVDIEAGQVGDPITITASVDPAPTWIGAGVGILAYGPPETGVGANLGVLLGPDGTGSITVDTDHWPAGTWWYDAKFSGSDRVQATSLRGEFVLVDIDPPVGKLQIGSDDVDTVISSVIGISWPADDGLGFGVAAAYLSNDGEAWAKREMYPVGGGWELLPGNGQRTIFAKWVDQAGNWSEIVSATVTVDDSLGHVTVPDSEPPPGGTIESGRLPLRVAFTGAESGEVVTGYEVQESVDGAPFKLAALVDGSAHRRVRAGHTYRYRVRALDGAGGHGPWATQTRGVSVSGFQQSSSRVVYRGTWRTRLVASAWRGVVVRATGHGASASIRTTSQAIAWVARSGPRLGKATVWVDGRKVATVNLYSATWSGPKVVWAADWVATKARTVMVRVVGTAGHPGVEIDGFYTLR
jgi:hypothetical protein